MEYNQAELLTDELSTLIDIEHMEDYSGRGMYGNRTSGVVVDSVSEFLSAIGQYLESADIDEMENIKTIGSALRKINVDNMGLSVIIY
jgi:hypothetical protein